VAAIAATRACTSGEVQTITVDTRSAFGAGLWAGFEVPWATGGDSCDWRFARLPSTDLVGDYMHSAWGDDGDVRILEFNGVPDIDRPSGSTWRQTVDAALAPPATRFILDQRMGYGGYPNAVSFIASRFLTQDEMPVADLYPRLETPLDEAALTLFQNCVGGMTGCGDFMSFVLEPALATLSDARLAMLTSVDVSGNDFLTRDLVFRGAPTRIFGPGPTVGGFGAVNNLPAHLGEEGAPTFQIEDSNFHTVAPVLPLQFESLTGVPPSEVALQTQSDLLQGRDTLLEAAKAWLRQ
jgi:hypothetical protein